MARCEGKPLWWINNPQVSEAGAEFGFRTMDSIRGHIYMSESFFCGHPSEETQSDVIISLLVLCDLISMWTAVIRGMVLYMLHLLCGPRFCVDFSCSLVSRIPRSFQEKHPWPVTKAWHGCPFEKLGEILRFRFKVWVLGKNTTLIVVTMSIQCN